jgi:hypothetical protein
MSEAFEEPQRHRDTESKTEEFLLVAKPVVARTWRKDDFWNSVSFQAFR